MINIILLIPPCPFPYNNPTPFSTTHSFLQTNQQPPSPAAPKQTATISSAVAMQGLRRYALRGDGGVRLELTPTTTSPLAIDVAESTETRIRRLISENPVIIFTRSACCMCHVMKRLLSAVGVHPTVIELEEDEMAALKPRGAGGDAGSSSAAAVVFGGEIPASPALYIGGACVGGLEGMVALHLSNGLVPMLVEVGALNEEILIN